MPKKGGRTLKALGLRRLILGPPVIQPFRPFRPKRRRRGGALSRVVGSGGPGSGRKKKKRPSPWNMHVKRVFKKNRNLSFKRKMEIASNTWKK